jgi:hypothetical protein
MDPAEIKQLIAEVSAQHGIRIDADDPIMAVVTLNRLILERTFSTATGLIHKATEEFNRAMERVQIRAGSVVAEEVRGAVATVREEMQRDIDNARLKACELVAEVHHAESQSRSWRWIVTGLLAGVGLFLAGVVAGTLLR